MRASNLPPRKNTTNGVFPSGPSKQMLDVKVLDNIAGFTVVGTDNNTSHDISHEVQQAGFDPRYRAGSMASLGPEINELVMLSQSGKED